MTQTTTSGLDTDHRVAFAGTDLIPVLALVGQRRHTKLLLLWDLAVRTPLKKEMLSLLSSHAILEHGKDYGGLVGKPPEFNVS